MLNHHALSLIHTFGTRHGFPLTNELANGSNCYESGDYICDTPADPNLYGLVSQDTDCNYLGGSTDANGQMYIPNTTNIISYNFC